MNSLNKFMIDRQMNALNDDNLMNLASKFKVLSEPSRLKIVRTLIPGEKCVTDIINDTELMQANVSKQLKILLQAGILTCKPIGLKRYYALTDSTVLQICQILCG